MRVESEFNMHSSMSTMQMWLCLKSFFFIFHFTVGMNEHVNCKDNKCFCQFEFYINEISTEQALPTKFDVKQWINKKKNHGNVM